MTCVCCGAPLSEHVVLLADPPPLVQCPRRFLAYGRGEPAVQRFGDPIQPSPEAQARIARRYR